MELDMTKGNPSRIIMKFFIPLFIGDLLQQFYGIIDAIVIGKFVGTDAFAAVGSSGAVIVFITSILIGLAMGASAIFSQLYGGRQYDELKQTISTALIFLFCISVLITIVTSVFLPQIISLYQMPKETAAYAADYLKYVFYGFIFVGMYNAFAFFITGIWRLENTVVLFDHLMHIKSYFRPALYCGAAHGDCRCSHCHAPYTSFCCDRLRHLHNKTNAISEFPAERLPVQRLCF